MGVNYSLVESFKLLVITELDLCLLVLDYSPITRERSDISRGTVPCDITTIKYLYRT